MFWITVVRVNYACPLVISVHWQWSGVWMCGQWSVTPTTTLHCAIVVVATHLCLRLHKWQILITKHA